MVLPPVGYRHSDTYFFLMRDLRTLCMWVAGASLLANFLPDDRKLLRWPKLRNCYLFVVDCVALVAGNWRTKLPSLQGEFLGFRERRRLRLSKRDGC